MAGGPINGSGVYGKTALEKFPAATIIVPTMLQIASDVIDSFANLTCIYDRYWYNRADVVTYPLCFFYVKSISETIQVETSEQRILLYEPQLTGGDATMKKLADQLRLGVQEVVVDNIVVKPKTYQLEIILPYNMVSKQMIRTVREAQQIFDAYFEIFAGAVPFESAISSQPLATQALQAASKVVDIAAKFPQGNAANFSNKNSLEAMAQSRRILTMKMWTGYEYKYVVMTGLDIKKVGNEDDVFRATLQVKEMPVLTVTPASDGSLSTGLDRNWAAQAVSIGSELLLEPLKTLTGVAQASGEGV